jgi:glycosyltransferase involved in cell wall biosynthesis
MRVLILTADFPPHQWSGIGSAVWEQARALTLLGCAVDIAMPQPPNYLIARSEHPGVRFHALCAEHFPVDLHHIDIVHVHSLSMAELALQIRRRFGIPLVCTAHSVICRELNGNPHAAFWSSVQGRLWAHCDRIVFPSRAAQRSAYSCCPGCGERSCVVPNPVSVPARRNQWRPPSCRRVRGPIVFAGRFSRTKGSDLLARIIPLVIARSDACFVVAGGHGEPVCQGALLNLAARYPARVTLYGWLTRDALLSLLAAASLALVPSRYEPFGMAALEPMSVGTPVLAAAHDGLCELVTSLRESEPVWSRLSRQGPAYIRRQFDPLTCGRRLIADAYEPVYGRAA